mmetsp:Transcript_33326/g.85438  ORF Transcript_33326/g.85438 Transcript_33326/m.85438 type:complete len:300 (-) Transcript_33326:894-1793(-)
MGPEEAGVLPYYVHNIARDDGLVVLAPGDLAQPQEVFDDMYQEPFLVVLPHRSRDGPDGPAEGGEALPRPPLAARGGVDLQAQLLDHYVLRLLVVEVREIHERLPHRLVKRNNLHVLQVLLDDVPVLVLHHQHLLGLGHAVNEDPADLVQDRRVCLEAGRLLLGERGGEHEGGEGPWPVHLERLVVQVVCEEGPVLRGDLEDLVIVDLANVDQVLEALQEVVDELLRLQDAQVGLEDGGEEEGQPLHKLLLSVPLVIVLLDGVGGDDGAQVGDEVGVELLHLGVVLGIDRFGVNGRNLR